MGQKITRQRAEKILRDRFYNKTVQFTYPGYTPVYGKCNQIAIEGTEVIMHIGNRRYTCSPESLNECLQLLTQDDGNNQ